MYSNYTTKGRKGQENLTLRRSPYEFSIYPATFVFTHRVTYAECTLGNHVYYSRYLEVLEAARNELFRNLGVPLFQWQQRQLIFPVIECRLRYKGPARYDDLLRVETWITMAAGVRLNFAYRLVNQIDQLILEAETCHVCTTLTEKPRRLPEELLIAAEMFRGKPVVA